MFENDLEDVQIKIINMIIFVQHINDVAGSPWPMTCAIFKYLHSA